ncbi:MAG TPA: glucan biosynthesis protein G [Verrucomicrobiae bacterium]|nr:glucan biosynthesis protein G [Verrucomicrobiae bacterium]
MTRLGCWIAMMGLAVCGTAVARQETADINLDYVAKRAEQRAQKPFRSPRADLPDILRADKLDYDKYREIEFRHDKALWAADDLPFRVEFFHPGYLYEEPVHIYEYTLTAMQPIRFMQDWFNYRGLNIQKQIPVNTGYAGFRLLYELNERGKWDEVGAFLGASYFRLLGKGQRYGQSARGLAIDCGETDRPEEFPIFTDWWLGKPARGEDRIRLYAILDSVSCAGAYEMVIIPGETTIADIKARLYFREDAQIKPVNNNRPPIRTVGIAPLTSMFWFGKASERRFNDYRPEVHDSDGLLIQMGNGEVLWRPLNNTTEMRHQRFAAKDIRGFGLLQRERDFAAYQDLFNYYHQVPSVWVETHGHWGEGEINLVELSTHYEGLDNIVAFWDPKDKPRPMEPYNIAYTLYWTRDEAEMKLATQDKVLATRIGADPQDPQRRQFAIDFAGPKLNALSDNTPPQAIASCGTNAVIVENQVFRNPFRSSWRVMLKIEPKPGNKDSVDLRCTLKKGEEVLTETWTYLWSPL